MAKTSLKERLKKKQIELKSKGGGGNIVFLKDGDKIRIRILNMGEDEEFVKEVTQFYLGGEIKGVISPVTFEEPCAVFNKYQELKNSEDPEDKELAKKFNIRKRYLAKALIYKDLKGKELSEEPEKFVLLTNGMYQDVIELYLDEDDWGDMSDPINGYDLKLGRTGSGKTDTEYSVVAVPKTKCPKPYDKKVYNLDEEIRKLIPSYEETEEILSRFLGEDISKEDEEKPKLKSGKRKIKPGDGKKLIIKKKTKLDG